tara:strand:- start:95 stop:409 length:315 start_codon:yes stop_codon:yes gene_type:complete
MPLPTPKKDETKDGFVSRCIENDVMNDEFPNMSQRIAVCVSQWDNKDKPKKEKKEKKYNEVEYDHVYNFTEKEMNELHSNGVLYVTQSDENGNKMVIKFTYKTN